LRGRRREYAEDSRDSERRSGRYSCTWISLSELGCIRQNLFVTSKRQDCAEQCSFTFINVVVFTDYFVFFSVGLVCGCLLEHTVVEPSRTESPSHSVILCCSVLNIILANSLNSVCGGQHCCSWSCSCRSLLVQALQ
jgi:hypothetical protein